MNKALLGASVVGHHPGVTCKEVNSTSLVLSPALHKTIQNAHLVQGGCLPPNRALYHLWQSKNFVAHLNPCSSSISSHLPFLPTSSLSIFLGQNILFGPKPSVPCAESKKRESWKGAECTVSHRETALCCAQAIYFLPTELQLG